MAARIRKYVEICRNCLPGDIKCTLSIQLGLGHSFFFFTLGLVTEVRRLIICKTVSRQLNLSGQHAYLNISRKFNALIVQYTLQTCNICVTIPCCLWIHDTTRSRSPYNTPHSPSYWGEVYCSRRQECDSGEDCTCEVGSPVKSVEGSGGWPGSGSGVTQACCYARACSWGRKQKQQKTLREWYKE